MRDKNGVYCYLCKSVRVMRQGQHLHKSNAIRHAQFHLGKMMYACGHCERRTATVDLMQYHLKSQHNIVQNTSDHFDDKSDDHFKEIKDMITKCFDPRTEPSAHQDGEVHVASVVAKGVRRKESALDQSSEGKVRVHLDGPKKQGRPKEVDVFSEKFEIAAHCRSIVPSRQKGCDAYALCNVCEEKRSVYTPSGTVNIDSILRHAQFHLGRSFYYCKLCDAQFSRNDPMQKHLREAHQCVSLNAADNYEDRTGEFAQEIKDKITECFGLEQALLSINKDPLHSRQVGSKSRDAHCHHDRLARIRQDHCWRLVQKVQKLGRIQCKRCDIPIQFSTRQANAPASLRSHILRRHLPKLAVYHCRMCTYKTAVYDTMKSHLNWSHHSASITGKFDNQENDFHEEIMAELSACFDSSGSKCTPESARNVTKRTHSLMSKCRRMVKGHGNCIKVGNRRKPLAPSSSRQDKSSDPFARKIFDQCTELIHKAPTGGQTIECQLCSKELAKHDSAKYVRNLIRHVEAAHLQKANYGCRHCPRRFVSFYLMAKHLRGQHKLASSIGQYVYFAEENHEALISLLKKCFDREYGDINGATNLATAAILDSTSDHPPPAKGILEDDSSNPSTSKEISTTRSKRYKCQVCPSTFVYELIYKKHMELFHSVAC